MSLALQIEPPETKVYWSACQECEWESKSFASEDETPGKCRRCGSKELAQCWGWV